MCLQLLISALIRFLENGLKIFQMDWMLQIFKLRHGLCLSEVLNNWVIRFSVHIDISFKLNC